MSESSSIPTVFSLPSISPAGFATPTHLLLENQAESLAGIANQVLADPVVLMKLCDRIYELMEQDLHYQFERSNCYGG